MEVAANPPTTNRARYVNLFQRRLATNLHFWRTHPAIEAMDVFSLDTEYETIVRVISLALGQADLWPTIRDLTLAFSPYMERRGHWSTWNPILQMAIAAARRADDIDGEITLSALLARLYQRQSRPKDVIYWYRRVIRMARQTGNRYEMARACSNLGYAYIDGGCWWRSEILCYEALTIFENLESEHGRAHTHNHLGVLYTRQHFWDRAEGHLKQACSFWKKKEDDHGMLRGLTNLGILAIEKEDFFEAINYLEKALDQAKLTGEETEIGNIWNNLGVAHRKDDNLRQAEICYKRAECIFRELSNLTGLALVWGNLGVIYSSQGDGSVAIKYLHNALNTFRQISNRDAEVNVLIDLIKHEFDRRNRLQVVKHLNELESLYLHHNWRNKRKYLEQYLANFRHNLINL